jgi:uncharacterized membrane protein
VKEKVNQCTTGDGITDNSHGAMEMDNWATADDMMLMFEACDKHAHFRTCNLTQKHEYVISHAHYRTCTLPCKLVEEGGREIGHPDAEAAGATVSKTIVGGGSDAGHPYTEVTGASVNKMITRGGHNISLNECCMCTLGNLQLQTVYSNGAPASWHGTQTGMLTMELRENDAKWVTRVKTYTKLNHNLLILGDRKEVNQRKGGD